MILPDFTATAVLQAAAIGATLGAALGLAQYVWRDWHVLQQRWEHWRAENRGELVGSFVPREPENYVENPVTEEDRRMLPLTIGWSALVGAGLGTGWETGTDWLTIIIALAAVVEQFYRALRREPVVILDPGHDRLDSLQSLGKRLLAVAASILFLLFAVVMALDRKLLWENGLNILPEDLFGYFWLAALAIALAVWGWRLKFGPSDALEDWEREEWEKDTGMALMVAIALAFVAGIVWLV